MIKLDIPNYVFRHSDDEKVEEGSLYYFEIIPGDYCLEFKLFNNMDLSFHEINGQLKWDGCMNWETNPSCMYHFCGPDDAFRLAKMFDYLYSFGKNYIEHWMD
jgi:hypothetical protein